ncbi:unnamed protein product [Gordionus sp. m RMFG-2023]
MKPKHLYFDYLLSSHLYIFALIFVITFPTFICDIVPKNVVYAINCGGEAHVDLDGIQYMKDPSKVGIDYISKKPIDRVNKHDAILYQSERYHHSSFGYDIPIKEDGDYVLVLKFSEIYFTKPYQKIFNILLNDENVVSGLDIYDRAGFCIAHDEIVPFTISRNKLLVNDKQIDIDGSITLTLEKTKYDNPKLNAFYVMKGKPEDIPPLPPISEGSLREDEEEAEEREADDDRDEVDDDDDDDEENLDVSHITNLHKKEDRARKEIIEREKNRKLDLLKRSSKGNSQKEDESFSQNEPVVM